MSHMNVAVLCSMPILDRKGKVVMLLSVPKRINAPHPRQLLISRRDFLVFCLCFVGTSCASASSTTNTPPSPSVTGAIGSPQPTATAPLNYQMTYTGHGGWAVWGVTWSPDGKHIASADEKSAVQVWDPITGRTLLTYAGHTGRVQAVAWSPDGKRVASAGDDKTVQVWDPMEGTLQATYRRHSNDILG